MEHILHNIGSNWRSEDIREGMRLVTGLSIMTNDGHGRSARHDGQELGPSNCM